MRRWAATPLLAAILLSYSTGAQATPVTGPWMTATTNPAGGQGNGPITNANTSSPTVGDGTANSADGEMFDSAFPTITLAFDGDKIVFTGSVRLIGSVGGAANPRTQYRFGLFDGDDDGLDDNGWVGYYMSNSSGNGTPAGTLARKPVGNTSIYLSTTGQNSLASTNGNGVNFADETYAMNLTFTKSGSNLLVSGTLSGASNGFTQTLSATDTTASTAGTFTFDHVGILLGGNLDADQAVFSNLDVSYISQVPESALGGMIALAGVLATAWRKAKRSAR